MPKHVWSITVKTDAGAGATDGQTFTDSAEQNIAQTVGIGNVEEVDIAITVANITSMFIESDQPCRLRTNSEVSPSQEFALTAGKALAWNNAGWPVAGQACPLSVNVTKLFFYNQGSKIANVKAGFLLNQESQFS